MPGPDEKFSTLTTPLDDAVPVEYADQRIEHDLRFRLEAGYVLGKAGCEVPQELTLLGLKDDQGNPAGEMEVIYNGNDLSV
ncbi:hypothetical protein LCGC14_1967290, partial [marine sediment metagenome]